MNQLTVLHQEYPMKVQNDNWIKDLQGRQRTVPEGRNGGDLSRGYHAVR